MSRGKYTYIIHMLLQSSNLFAFFMYDTISFMKIAILGGAFDPPHLGHQIVARQVLEKMQMDEVWLMVCDSYFPEFPIKYARITSYSQRSEMTSYITEKRVLISDFEHTYNKKSRTIDTLKLLKKRYPAHEFSWILGSDTLPTFSLWNDWQSIIKNHNLIIFPRDTDFKTLEKRVKKYFKLTYLPANISIVENDVIVSNIASTHIRKRIRNNLSVAGLVTKKVEKYIKINKLYICKA